MRPISFVVGAICAGLACSSSSALSPAQSGDAGTEGGQLIGPQGGSISQSGATLVIPPGALSSEVAFRIDDVLGPSVRDSDLFAFTPEVTFATPATITFPMYGAVPDAHIYWISPTNGGLADLGGVVSGSSITGQVSRLPGAAYACDLRNCGPFPGVPGADASADATD
jgi:hypothetical protein